MDARGHPDTRTVGIDVPTGAAFGRGASATGDTRRGTSPSRPGVTLP